MLQYLRSLLFNTQMYLVMVLMALELPLVAAVVAAVVAPRGLTHHQRTTRHHQAAAGSRSVTGRTSCSLAPPSSP